MCTQGPCTFDSAGAHLASRYSVDNGKITIDGELFPWLLEERGPRVESLGHDDWMHILWAPILVEGPMIPSVTEAPGESAYSHLTPMVKPEDDVAKGQLLGHAGGSAQVVANLTVKHEPNLTVAEWDERSRSTHDE